MADAVIVLDPIVRVEPLDENVVPDCTVTDDVETVPPEPAAMVTV